MEHKIKLYSAAKIIACILIISLVLESVVAAPLADNQQQQKEQQTGNKLNISREKGKNVKRNNQRNNNGLKWFSQKDYEAWTNPCNANSYEDTGSPIGTFNPIEEYNTVQLNIEDLQRILFESNKINITNIEAFDEFNAQYYEFLPKFPTGNHRKWHFDMQIFTASFGLLHKFQPKTSNEELAISKELKDIFIATRKLLCEIEGFVNTTSSQKIGTEDWIKKKEMRELLDFKNLTEMMKLHQMYAKGRFQTYIEKLLQRIKQQSKRNYVEKSITFPKHKSLALRKKKTVTRRPIKGRRINNNNRPQKHQPINGENLEMSTKKLYIVRTTKISGRNNKNMKMNNKRRQRTTKASILQHQQQQQKNL
ncbi:hypothetical protein PVAND_013126 [Polypedilum vanderplanki]|uniref:Uncharacterized protein n=1 Tax=Polypedilum vanderplanki TaxID=319348 RepID=A0A9J6CPH7_POLVA|nr:hypothetical protein PVAND_013126 [Polypedilum vanderplanki]